MQNVSAECCQLPPTSPYLLPLPSCRQVAEGQHALQLASAHTTSVSEELNATQESLAERKIVLEGAHAAVAEKDRRIRELEVGGCGGGGVMYFGMGGFAAGRVLVAC